MKRGILRAKLLIDDETGEILASEREGDRVKYVKNSSIESYRDRLEKNIEQRIEELKADNYEAWTMEYFYKGNIKELQSVMKELDVYEKAFLFSIAPYVGYEDCRIKYANGNDLSFEKIVEISGISKGKLSEVIKSLIDKDILYKGKNSKNTQYFVNPWLFCKGNRINKVLKGMFRNYRIRILNKKWSEI